MEIDKSCKYEKVQKKLIELILNNHENPSYRLPAENQLARELQLSRVTVRKAYDELEGLGLIVRKRGSGTFIASDLSSQTIEKLKTTFYTDELIRIGIITPSITSEYIINILNEVSNYTQKKGLTNVIFQYAITNHDMTLEAKAIENFLKSGVRGLLVYPIDGQNYNPTLIKLSLQNFPVVLIDRTLPGLNFNFVSSNNKLSFAETVNMLVRLGHKNIAFFSATPQPVSTGKERLSGYETGLKQNNLPITARFEVIAENAGDAELTLKTLQSNYEHSVERIRSLVLSGEISAVICACTTSSVLLLRVMDELEKKHPAIKRKISVVYCDIDYATRSYVFPAPTCLIQDYAAIANTSIEILLNQIFRRSETHQNIHLPIQLIKGNTVFQNG